MLPSALVALEGVGLFSVVKRSSFRLTKTTYAPLDIFPGPHPFSGRPNCAPRSALGQPDVVGKWAIRKRAVMGNRAGLVEPLRYFALRQQAISVTR